MLCFLMQLSICRHGAISLCACSSIKPWWQNILGTLSLLCRSLLDCSCSSSFWYETSETPAPVFTYCAIRSTHMTLAINRLSYKFCVAAYIVYWEYTTLSNPALQPQLSSLMVLFWILVDSKVRNFNIPALVDVLFFRRPPLVIW